MRFHRCGRYEFKDTARKRAAFLRKQRAERESAPLFADQIAEEQAAETVDAEMQARAERWNRDFATVRQRRAEKWCEARARLRSYAEPTRSALLAYWQACRWPGDPVYLLAMLHMFDHGRLNAALINRNAQIPGRT